MELDTLGLSGSPNTQGATADSDTYALWKFDESTASNWLTISDIGTAGVNLTGGTIANTPRPAPGPVTSVYSRLCSAVRNGAQNTSNAGAAATTYQGSWTFEAYIFVNALGTNDLYSYGASGESLATNIQMSISITAGGKIQAYWEYGAGGSDQTVIQVAGSAITAGSWFHIAVAKDSVAKNVLFYINGTLQDTVAYVNEAAGGTSATHFLASRVASGATFVGRVCDIRISNIVRDAATIAADAALISTTCQQPNDANTYILWRMQEAADAVDAAGRLPLTISATAADVVISSPLVNPQTGYSKTFLTSNGSMLLPGVGSTGSTVDDWVTSLCTVLRGDFSMEMWIYPPVTGTTRGIFYLNATGESVATNLMGATLLLSGVNYTLKFDWETGAGVNQTYTTGNLFTISQLELGAGIHLAFTKTVTAGNLVWRTYVNGALVDTSGSITNFDGTGAVDESFLIGDYAGSTFLGTIDDVRLSSIARDASAILATYTLGAGGGVIAKRPHP